MKLIITKDYQELSQKAYEAFKEILHTNSRPRIGLATGSSPLGLYHEIVKSFENGMATYKDARVYNLDEYIGLDKDHKNRYSHFLYEHILSKADFQDENVDLILSATNDIKKESERYHKLLINDPLDIQILGLGSNCHIGFNEPGTLFDSQTHVVDLKEETRKSNARFFSSIDEVPKKAITVGIKDIMSAKNIILIASGKNKACAVKRMFEETISTDCPASILRVHKSVTVIVDEDAASLLDKKRGI